MKMTVQYAKEQFSRFNALCFDGALDEIPIILTRATSFVGKLCWRRERKIFRGTRNVDLQIRLSSEFDLPESEWQDVIIHEMIHGYIAANNLRDTSAHGSLFRGMMTDINRKYGRNVTIRHKSSPGTLSPRLARKRTHYVCISTFRDGRQGITVCSEAMASRIDRGLPHSYRLAKRDWYMSEDLYFNSFPHSRLPRIYKIGRSDLEEHLASAAHIGKISRQ